MTIDPELADLEQLLRDIDKHRTEIAARIAELTAARAPFQPGDIVEAKIRGLYWQPAIIRQVSATSTGTYWYRVSSRRADGSWAKHPRNAYSDVRAPQAAA